jgi:hypothetical protein
MTTLLCIHSLGPPEPLVKFNSTGKTGLGTTGSVANLLSNGFAANLSRRSTGTGKASGQYVMDARHNNPRSTDGAAGHICNIAVLLHSDSIVSLLISAFGKE